MDGRLDADRASDSYPKRGGDLPVPGIVFGWDSRLGPLAHVALGYALSGELVRDNRSTDGQINPRLVTSIQQSLAAEGYVSSEKTVRDVGERVTR